MYAGFITSKHSANWLGAHQKFNRASFVALRDLITNQPDRIVHQKVFARFPEIKRINNYEGYNGPDGIKVKSPAQNEPWHYYDPFDQSDDKIFPLIEQHFSNLVSALAKDDTEKAAFEASWLSHTITDGLTPAHHYPYEQELVSQMGRSKEERTTKSKKLIAKGDNIFDTIRRNYRIHGGKGILSAHIHFEAGITSAIIFHRIRGGRPSDIELEFARRHGIIEVFKRNAEQIARMNLYNRFHEKGWTRRMARNVREDLSPAIVRTVATAWFLALEESMQ